MSLTSMCRSHRASFVVLLLTAAVACLIAAAPTVRASAGPEPADTLVKPWTLLIYLDGDNNLDYEGWWTMDAVAAGLEPDGNVNVFVLYDHEGDGGAEEYIVTAGGYEKVGDIAEPDMGDPATMETFLVDAIRRFPADKYVLDVWDHGGGWIGVCKDDVSGTEMTIPGLGAALEAATGATGARIAITNFEACCMAAVEVAAQLQGSSDFVLGSEVTMDAYGIPWAQVVAAMEADPALPAADLAQLTVDAYVADKVERSGSQIVAQYAAVETAQLPALLSACDGLALTLTAGMHDWSQQVCAAAAWSRCQVWMSFMGVFWFADLWNFADQVALNIDDPAVASWAEAVKAALDGCVYEGHPELRAERLRGITVSFPPNRAMYDGINYFDLDYDEIGLTFADTTAWDEMLDAYYAECGEM